MVFSPATSGRGKWPHLFTPPPKGEIREKRRREENHLGHPLCRLSLSSMRFYYYYIYFIIIDHCYSRSIAVLAAWSSLHRRSLIFNQTVMYWACDWPSGRGYRVRNGHWWWQIRAHVRWLWVIIDTQVMIRTVLVENGGLEAGGWCTSEWPHIHTEDSRLLG